MADYNATSLSGIASSKASGPFRATFDPTVLRPDEEAFDIIFMFQVLEHMDRVDEVFARLSIFGSRQGPCSSRCRMTADRIRWRAMAR